MSGFLLFFFSLRCLRSEYLFKMNADDWTDGVVRVWQFESIFFFYRRGRSAIHNVRKGIRNRTLGDFLPTNERLFPILLIRLARSLDRRPQIDPWNSSNFNPFQSLHARNAGFSPWHSFVLITANLTSIEIYQTSPYLQTKCCRGWLWSTTPFTFSMPMVNWSTNIFIQSLLNR